MHSTLSQEEHGRDRARPSNFPPSSLLRATLLLLTLGLLWFILCRQLSFEWSANKQYSYGWFVPFFAAFLFWQRWEDWKKQGAGSREQGALTKRLLLLLALCSLLFLLPLRLFEVANPDWRPLSWAHALIVVSLTLLAIGYWGRWPAARHFAFPVCFILVAVPWLTPIEAPLVQGLMRLVAAVATETLSLFGIPAQLEGSLIRVNSAVVGVSEACSGVRSLQTSLMIGLLFGELKRFTIRRRIGLVVCSLTIALLANFGRALFLVSIAATQNLTAVERWHDLAGYAIVVAVFLGTVVSAKLLEGRAPARPGGAEACPSDGRPQTSDHRRHAFLHPSSFFLLTFSWLLLIEAAVSGWYRAHERSLVPTQRWIVQWPESAPGFTDLAIDEHTREMLRYNTGREVSWNYHSLVRPDDLAPERAARAYLFFFRWEPGTATVLRARAHRPDICLPAVGWKQIGEPEVRFYAVSDRLALPFQHLSFTRDDEHGPPVYAETFFCLREDRVRPETKSHELTLPFSYWSIPERWQAVHNGMRNPGQQVMEFVLLTRHQLARGEAEAEFARLAPRLIDEEGRP